LYLLFSFLNFLRFIALIRTASHFRLTRTADAIDIKGKAIFMEAPRGHLVDSVNDFLGLHLCHLAAHGAYLVAVTVIVVTSLILGGRLETVTHHQAQLNQQAQCVV
jgi:hypothetical protein